jgi:putative phosphoserine phosphatase/1-acylglycerol-3-phosphate O-acyltransferase
VAAGITKSEARPAYRAITAAAAVIMAPFARLHTERMDIAVDLRYAIVVANHRSFFDVLVVLSGFRRMQRYPRLLVAIEYFERRSTGWALRAIGAVPVDRKRPGDIEARVRAVLDAGIPIFMLPEGRLAGTPGDPLSLGEFRTGAARIANSCGAQVWALGHVGTDALWPRTARLPRLNPFNRKEVVAVGSPIELTMTGDAVSDTAMIRADISELLVEAQSIRQARAAKVAS